MTAPWETSVLFPSNFDFVSGNIKILRKQNSCFPREQSLSVYCELAAFVDPTLNELALRLSSPGHFLFFFIMPLMLSFIFSSLP